MNYEGSAPRPSFTGKLEFPRKQGRPRKDEMRKRVRELRERGLSWAALTRKLNHETGEDRSQSTYRGYFKETGSHKRK